MIKFEVGDLVYFPKDTSLADIDNNWVEYEKTTILLILKTHRKYNDDYRFYVYDAFDGINKVTIDHLVVDLCIKIAI